MKKLDAIKSQLAQRLGEAAGVQSATPSFTSLKPVVSKKAKETVGGVKKNESTDDNLMKSSVSSPPSGTIKLSVSLYNHDIECLDRIREFMRERGVRNLSDSEALRLACRAVSIDEQFVEIYQAMQKEDKRRRTD